MSDPILQAKGLRKSFGGVRAVDGVSLTVEAGEMVALIGPNGAGKSTCFNMLGGQLRPDSGEITLGGRSVSGLSPRRLARRGMGRTFQIAQVFASMTVRENVQLALLSHRGEVWRGVRGLRRRAGAEADGLLERSGLAAEAEVQAGALAYGDAKRLELALALAGDPGVLLLDEPTAGMGAAERTALIAAVRRIVCERRLAVLFTEHDMDVVFGAADRVLVMDRGRLIAAGAPQAVRADRRVRAVYLGEDG